MRRLLIPALGLLAVMLVACGGGDSEPTATPQPSVTPIPPSPTPRPTATPVLMPQVETDPALAAQFRVVHASPDLPAVDLALDGARVGSRFTEGLYNTQPLSFRAGTYTLRVTLSGAEEDAAPLLDYPLDLDAGDSLILLLLGTPDDPSIVTYREDLSGLPLDTARVSVIHAVPRGATVDVQMDAAPLLDDLEFGTQAGPVEVASGAHQFEFVTHTDTLAALDLQLAQRVAYTLLLVGSESGDTRAIFLQNPVRSQTELRVIHAAPGVPQVNVTLGDETLAEDLGFGGATDWHVSEVVARTLRVAPAEGGDPLYEEQIVLRPDRALDLVIMGTPEDLAVAPIDDDHSPTPQNAARLIFVNAAPDHEQVSVAISTGDVPGVPTLNYGSGSSPVEYPARQIVYDFADANPDNPVAVGKTIDRVWQAGHAYAVIVTGDLDTEPLLIDDEVGTSDNVMTFQGAVEASNTLGGTYRVRVINALAQGGAIDVLLGETTVASNVALRTASDYAETQRISTTLSVRDSSDGESLVEGDYSPPADAEAVVVFVYGKANDVQFTVASDSRFASGSGAWLRVFHAAPDHPDLRVMGQGPVPLEASASGGAEPTPELTPLPPATELVEIAHYGQPTNAALLLPGAYRVDIVSDATAVTLYTTPTLAFTNGAFYDLLILPDATGISLDLVLLPRGD